MSQNIQSQDYKIGTDDEVEVVLVKETDKEVGAEGTGRREEIPARAEVEVGAKEGRPGIEAKENT